MKSNPPISEEGVKVVRPALPGQSCQRTTLVYANKKAKSLGMWFSEYEYKKTRIKNSIKYDIYVKQTNVWI